MADESGSGGGSRDPGTQEAREGETVVSKEAVKSGGAEIPALKALVEQCK